VVAARSALVAHGGRLGGRGRRRARRRHSPNAKGDGEPRGRRRLRREVDLTPEQVVVADSILRHEFEAMNGIREDTWPQMQAIMDDTRRKLDSVLSPANASDITRCWRSRSALSVRATPRRPSSP
jgi:hypothetical protein